MRTITITETEEHLFNISGPDWFADHLNWEEALGVVIKWQLKPYHDGMKIPYSKDIETFFEMEKRIKEKIAADLRPVDRLELMARGLI